jgi:predicted DNA-binding transcriptional regulator AlpA
LNTFSTSQVAKRLGIGIKTLSRYIAEKKVPAPQIIDVGGRKVHVWTEPEIAGLQQLLPKIANGRKTRYSKLREKQKPQPGAAVPHKSRRTKKKVRTKPPKANG